MILVAPIELLFHSGESISIYKSVMIVAVMLYVAWAYAGLFDGKITILTMAKGFVVILIATLIELITLNMIIVKRLPF